MIEANLVFVDIAFKSANAVLNNFVLSFQFSWIVNDAAIEVQSFANLTIYIWDNEPV